jgi:hypothetical protein
MARSQKQIQALNPAPHTLRNGLHVDLCGHVGLRMAQVGLDVFDTASTLQYDWKFQMTYGNLSIRTQASSVEVRKGIEDSGESMPKFSECLPKGSARSVRLASRL